ncbi:TIGR04282 family arsenosugar biosynthesis glycosyltransferase [Croceiramulus getboli]|nr:TIGR04282 family arsenosugar biosynthesis glycosyltransferase [Flavobacteriaceae bacterium YJPT1-3]
MQEKNSLLIFTRNPELGKCKTRLAATVGDESALAIYRFLLQHTVSITKELPVHKEVHYSVAIRENDLWDPDLYHKELQQGADLGARMEYAFAKAFQRGQNKVIIMGSDLYDLTTTDLQEAFNALEDHDFVVGPATDGGYYLLGMKSLYPALFKNKAWGTDTVLEATLDDLNNENVKLLPERNDIDYYEDLEGIAAFEPFLPQHLKHG